MNGDAYVAEGLVLLVQQNRKWGRSSESDRAALRQKHNAELNALRGRHGLNTDRFTTEFKPRWDEPPKRYRGSEGVDAGDDLTEAARWLANRRRQFQPKSGEAILAAQERSETP